MKYKKLELNNKRRYIKLNNQLIFILLGVILILEELATDTDFML